MYIYIYIYIYIYNYSLKKKKSNELISVMLFKEPWCCQVEPGHESVKPIPLTADECVC